MNSTDLKQRTKKFAGDIIRFVEKLPQSRSTEIISKQLIRSSTSVAANYRSVCRARSRADFINKHGIVEEETDETLFWLEMLVEIDRARGSEIALLSHESSELLAIMTSSRKTAKLNNNK